MKIHFTNNIVLIAVIALAFWSCSTPQHFKRDNSVVSGIYGSSENTDSTSIGNKKWSEIFSDPNLSKLIDEGLSNNPDIRKAIQKVTESEAYFSQSKVAVLPSLSDRKSACRERVCLYV